MHRPAAISLLLLGFCSSAQAMPGDLLRDEYVNEQLEQIRQGAKALRLRAFSLPPDAIPGSAVTPDPSQYKVRGIDISHYQDDVDWAKVAKDGISFAYMKASEGSDLPDEKFKANWAGAGKAGLLKGAYHFYNLCGKGDPQADFFTGIVPAEPGNLPPAIDLEATKNCKASLPDKKTMQKEFAAFVVKVKAKYRQDPLIYINETLYTKYFAGDEVPFHFWICDISAEPALSDSRKWEFWQYTWKGRVAGINGDVDLDVFSGTLVELAALTGVTEPVYALAPGGARLLGNE